MTVRSQVIGGALAATVGFGLMAPLYAGGVVPATIIVVEDQTTELGPINALNQPFTNGLGQVGFTGTVSGRAGLDAFVWFNGEFVWFNSEGLPDALSGGESTMGVGDEGEFIYSPSVNAKDAVWGHNGLILQETDPAPGLASSFITFCSRPRMLPDGRSYWLSGISTSQGGATEGRALFTRSPRGEIAPIVASGESIDGLVLSDVGVDFDYDVADNNAFRITIHDTTAEASMDALVAVNGGIVAREGEATGGGDTWQNFESVSINNLGDWLLAGDTSAAATADEFIAFNGEIKIRESDTIAGIPLSGGSVSALSLNNMGQAVFTWSLAAAEVLFFAEAPDLADATVLLQIGDAIDTDGDLVADATVNDLNASGVIGPGLDLADTGELYLAIDANTASGKVEMIIAIDLPGDPPSLCPADIFPTLRGDGVVGPGDLGELLSQWGSCSDKRNCSADLFPTIGGDDIVGPGDLGELLAQWGLCR